jgi:formate hydrogenlyase subunit 3/multisubunit Na+/H+ antiporter MnhD subunit
LEFGIWPLSLLILSSIFALIAYALALSRNWWGPPPDNASPPEATSKSVAREPFALKAAIVVLAVILVTAGVLPSAWQFLLGVRP